WKGNIHTHSLWSDGDDFPEMISEWYRTRDYNFLAITDHNILSVGQKWMKLSEVKRRGGEDALAKYRARFGADWVVTRGEPGNANHEVLLKPLNEFRALIEERGKFILVQGEEISDRSEGKPVHMNATNLRDLLAPVGGATVREAIANNFRAVREQADRSKREILLHLNHPNFGLAVTAEDLAAVTAERFFEIYNGHPGVQQLGDANHPSVERLWDIANTIRLGELKAPPMFGVGTDDSHDYHGSPGSRPGRGWVMVRSRYLTPNHLVRAMKAGDFYASSGVVLNDVSYDPSTRLLKVDIRPVQGARFTTRFIGTLADYDAKSVARQDANGKPIRSSRKYSDDVGRVLGETEGLSASIRLSGKELYVRAVVTSSVDHPDPSYAKQKQQAWTQPVGWRTRLK
ncbi:MAG: hypothetical protein QF805_26650, partial [Pirellulaceae bacterium]|nr:hypothetical protein [Pirellulaceae bacterium]